MRHVLTVDAVNRVYDTYEPSLSLEMADREASIFWLQLSLLAIQGANALSPSGYMRSH